MKQNKQIYTISMKTIDQTANIKPNLKYYKMIADKGELFTKYNFLRFEPFEIFKLEFKDNKENFSGGYLATANRKTKDIDIYKIYSKDNIKLIHSLEVGYDTIHTIKYFYDQFHKVHYLTALINQKQKIKIWKINSEKNYHLISNYIKKMCGYLMSFITYTLMFNKEQTFLITCYGVQSSCTSRYNIIEIYDFINEKQMEEFYESDYYFREFIKIFSFNINLGISSGVDFTKYVVISYNKENNYNYIDFLKKTLEVKEIELGRSHFNGIFENGVIIREKNEDDILFYNEYYDDYQNGNNDKNFIHKYNLTLDENLFQFEINIKKPIFLSVWNKNYLLIFEQMSKNILLFNVKTCRIENQFNNGDNILYKGKKLVINNNEELLFVIDLNGIISLWINA